MVGLGQQEEHFPWLDDGCDYTRALQDEELEQIKEYPVASVSYSF
jgi:hypothetical protein